MAQMDADALRAALADQVINEAVAGPTGDVLVDHTDLPGGGAVVRAVPIDVLADLFAGVDWADGTALVAADHRKRRIDTETAEAWLANPDGTFDPNAPDRSLTVVEDEVDFGYAEALARWHDEGRFA